jgi:hypothetical protein
MIPSVEKSRFIQGVPELRKSSITCLLLKISTFHLFLDEIYASTAIRKILRYIYRVSQYCKNTKVMFFFNGTYPV